MILRWISKFYGALDDRHQLAKFVKLGAIFFCIIAMYQSLTPIRNTLFNVVVGWEYLPYARVLSLGLMMGIILFYSKLVDLISRNRLFYLFVIIYLVLIIVFYIAFNHPTVGLANTVRSPARLLGWFWYMYVETFGALFPALFWAIATDTTTPPLARKGFPLIAFAAQLGNVCGPLLINARRYSFSSSLPILLIEACVLLLVLFLMYYYFRSTPPALMASYADESETHEHQAGFFEGLRLLITKRYLGALFALVIIFEIILSILDIHFQRSVFLQIPDEVGAAAYFANYGVWIGLVALGSLILGVSNLQRLLGMRISLLLVPLMLLGSILGIVFFPESVPFAFWALVGVRGINYAFNQPTIKQLYIPTSKEAKYKSQAWIEMFGGPIGKSSGSLFNTLRGHLIRWCGIEMGIFHFMTIVILLSSVLGMCWITAIFFIAKKYRAAIKRNDIVC